MIAWRQFEIAAKAALSRDGYEVPHDMQALLRILPLSTLDSVDLGRLGWSDRNKVIHRSRDIKKEDAERVLKEVEKFIENNISERERHRR